ncbi:MAG: hypothetical protein AAFQ43_07730 [Bacteroidota bacterium]
MRPLFMLARGLFLAGLLPLAACDSAREPFEVGAWTLVSVTGSDGEAVAAPLGSRLVFFGGGRFEIVSGNTCSGRYASEFVVNTQVLDLEFDACTEVGTTFETDLNVVLGAFGGGVSLDGPFAFASDPRRLGIYAYAPEATYTLLFEAE